MRYFDKKIRELPDDDETKKAYTLGFIAGYMQADYDPQKKDVFDEGDMHWVPANITDSKCEPEVELLCWASWEAKSQRHCFNGAYMCSELNGWEAGHALCGAPIPATEWLAGGAECSS